MRTRSPKAKYPILRQSFADWEEIAEIINRSRSYVCGRMVGRGVFTQREKLMILQYIGISKDRILEVFDECL